MKSKNLLPGILTIVFFILLSSMGTWQLFRLDMKKTIIQHLEFNQNKPFIPVTCKALKHGLEPNMIYKKVIIEGELARDVAYLYSQGPKTYVLSHKLKKYPHGYNLIYKFKCNDGEQILLDYGWVNTADKTIAFPKQSIKVHGWLMPPDHKKLFVENNKDNSNIWFWVDVPKIADKLGVKYYNSQYFYILKAYKPDGYPVGRDLDKSLIRNDHLAYAITWYALAIVSIIIYYFYKRSNK